MSGGDRDPRARRAGLIAFVGQALAGMAVVLAALAGLCTWITPAMTNGFDTFSWRGPAVAGGFMLVAGVGLIWTARRMRRREND